MLKEDKLTDKIPVAILPASDGSLWIPYSDGLRRIQDGQVRNFTTLDGISSDNVLSVYEDRRGVIWALTTGGIDRLEKDRFVAVSTTNNTSIGRGDSDSGRINAVSFLHLDLSAAPSMSRKLGPSGWMSRRRSQAC